MPESTDIAVKRAPSAPPAAARPTLLCIPGLGGHPSAFGLYPKLLPEYKLRSIQLVNRAKAEADALDIIKEEEKVILLCSCYAVQLGLKLAAAAPDKVEGLVLIEPFFAEFQWWRLPAVAINKFLSWGCVLTDKIGLRRRRFTYQPDYVALSKYPIYVQPVFDMHWQNLTDYFDKTMDILTFRLPERVDTPALILFSPRGFTKDRTVRARIKAAFPRSQMAELPDGTHNIITMMDEAAAGAIRTWLKKHPEL